MTPPDPNRSGRLAPGPRGRETLRLLKALKANAAEALADLSRTYGDVVQFRFFGRLNTLVVHPDLVHTILVQSSGDLLKGRVYDAYKPVIGDGLLTADGETWATSRKVAQPAFRGPRLAAFASVVSEAADAAVARWSAAGDRPVEMVAALNALTFGIIARALFTTELPADEQTELFSALAAANEEGTARIRSPLKLPLAWPTPANQRYRAAVKRLDAVVERIIETRRRAASPPDDYLTALIAAERAGTIDGKTVRDQSITFLFAGHETTSNALAFAFHLVSRHPAWADRIADEARAARQAGVPLADARASENLPVARAVFEETMRLYPPIYALQRRSLKPLEVGGYTVPAGTGITISPYATHRHQAFWPDPQRFDPERFLGPAARDRPRGAYIPFGLGPRTCIGANFAMLEGVLLLSRIVEQLVVHPFGDGPVEAAALISLSPKGGLSLRFSPRPGALQSPSSVPA